ncbi:MAG: tetratricopeptide repeat protein [Myxococcales bacterium]|nr:tetratricopeptide repeat protein [Myxococcales bacterium]
MALFSRSPLRGILTTRRLLVLTLLGPVDPNPALADDWQVVRSEFDPRLIGELKEQVRRNPDDAGLLRRLCGLYRKHSSIDKLGAEVLAVAQKSGQASDLYLTALIARERGQLDEASKLLEQAVQRGGLEEAKVALLLADLAQKKTPADVATARKQLARALGLLKPGDGRRKSVLRKQIDLALQAQDQPDAEQKLRALIESSQGVESQRLRQELAELLARGGKNKEALAEWQELATKLGGESKAQALLRIGELQELLRDDLAAMATYRQSQKLLGAGHHLRRDVSEHLIALSRKRDELPQFIQQFEAEHPAAQRGFGEWELLGRLYDERGDTKAALAAYRGALRSDPHSIDVRRRLIAILERGGVTPEVLSEYEQLIVQAPGDSRGYLELAERQWKVGQKQRALGTLRRAAARFSADPSLHSALAELYSRWGEADLALQESELLVRLDPREESYIVNLGELYWARGKKDRAEEIWKRLLTMGGSRAQGQARLADIYAEHSMMPQALDLYQKAVTAEPNNLQLRRGLAQAYERLSRNRDSVAMWEQIYFAAKGPAERLVQLEARKRLGSLLSKETRLQATLYTWQRRLAAALNQSNQTLLPETLLLGLLVAEVEQQLGKPGEAEQVLSRLRVRLPDGPQLAEVLLSLAQVLRAQRKLEEAIAVLKQAATLLPERQRELYAQLAELSMQSYRDGDAIRYAEQAVADASGELALGEILERRDEVQRAMAAYQRAMERDPRLFRAHMALARLHVQRGELTEAAALYREVVRRTPQEELVLEAGRKAIDLHEFLGSLGELLKELSPLAYSVVPKPVYRRLLLLAYERYAAPLAALSKSGDASAQAELQRLGQGGLKPLTESLTEGDGQEQRVAVALLGELRNPSAVPSLLNVAMAGLPLPGQESRTVLGAANLTGGSVRPSVDMDLRVDALLAVAKLTDPQSISSLLRLAKSREKQLRLAAYYGLFLLADKLDREKLGQVEAGLLDTTPAGRALVALVLGRASELQHQPLSPKVRGLFLSTLEKRRLRSDEADELFTMAVVQALGRSRDKTVVPPLMELLRLGNDEIERHAAWALGRLQDVRAVAPLLRAVFGKSSSVRVAAVSALGQLGSPVAPSASGSASERLPSDRRGLDGLDVARLLSDLVSEPSPVSAQPAWLDSPGEVAAALRDGLEESPDLALRTLEDLLYEDVTSRRGLLRLYPLSLAVPQGSLPPSLAVSVLPTILPSLRKLALPGSGDVSLAHVQLAAVRVLGQVALSDVAESGRAAAILKDVIELGTGSQVLLLAASLYAQLPTTLRDGQPVFDRLLAHPERWVRLQALRLAAEPNARSLLSAAMRTKACQDSDGFIREAAERIK